MVKSATADIVKESAKLDLHTWLAGGKLRTKTVQISNNPALAAEIDALVERMNALAEQIQSQDAPSGGIADDDPASEWDELDAQYQALDAEYKQTLRPFTFRAQKPTDPDEVRAELKAAKVPPSNENLGIGMIAHTLVDPPMTYQDLMDALSVLGNQAFYAMNDAFLSLAAKQKEPSAPLSLRP